MVDVTLFVNAPSKGIIIIAGAGLFDIVALITSSQAFNDCNVALFHYQSTALGNVSAEVDLKRSLIRLYFE